MLWYSCRFCCKHDIIVKFEQLSFKPVWRLQDVVYTFHRPVGSMVWQVWQVRQTASLRFVPLGTMMHSRQIAEILWLLVQLCLSLSHPPLCSRHNFIGTSACRNPWFYPGANLRWVKMKSSTAPCSLTTFSPRFHTPRRTMKQHSSCGVLLLPWSHGLLRLGRRVVRVVWVLWCF